MIVIDKSPKDVIPNISEKCIFKTLIILEMPYHIAFMITEGRNNTYLNWFGRDIRDDGNGAKWGWQTQNSLINFLINCWNRWESNDYNRGNIRIYVCENIEEVNVITERLEKKITDSFKESLTNQANEVFQ